MGEAIARPWVIVAAAALALSSFGAEAATITVTSATVTGGKLIVIGKTPGANQTVRLDNRYSAKSNASNVFTFTITDYLPTDCKADLTAPGATGVAKIKNCVGTIIPRGVWSATVIYLVNDVVTLQGFAWLAKKAGKGKPPSTSPSFWTKFVSGGAAGDAGSTGDQGAQGVVGADGLQGPPGDTGDQGAPGAKGSTGNAGPAAIVSTVNVATSAGTQAASSTLAFVAVVTPTSVSLAAGELITASLSMGARGSSTFDISLGLCYQLNATPPGPVTLFDPGALVQVQVNSTENVYAASLSTSPGAGNFRVGLCMVNAGGSVTTGHIQGWVRVTR